MATLFGRMRSISAGKGQSAVQAAAYRSCSNLIQAIYDQSSGITATKNWNYQTKSGLVFSEIIAPDNVPSWVFDRETLWNNVEKKESRVNSEYAKEYVMALPKEFTREQNIELIREFVEEAFTSQNIVVDVNYHADNPSNPHAHMMFLTRDFVEDENGNYIWNINKNRSIKPLSFTENIKSIHTEIMNSHYKKHGFNFQLSWKKNEELEPGFHHHGIPGLIRRNQEIARENAEKIIANPEIIIDELGRKYAAFSDEMIKNSLEKTFYDSLTGDVTDNKTLKNYIAAEVTKMASVVMSSDKLTLINPNDIKGRMVFAKTSQVELEERFLHTANEIAEKAEHKLDINNEDIGKIKGKYEFTKEQKTIIKNICKSSDLATLEGYPGSGKSTVTAEIVKHYKEAGYEIVATAFTNKAAQELEEKLNIKVSTTASLKRKWQKIRGFESDNNLKSDYCKQDDYNSQEHKKAILSKNTLFVIDEASTLSKEYVDYLLDEVKKSGCKVLFLGDNNQQQAIGMKGAYYKLCQLSESTSLSRSQLTEVNRHQNQDNYIKNQHIEATKEASRGNSAAAIEIYNNLNAIKLANSDKEKINLIVDKYTESIIKRINNKAEHEDKYQALRDVAVSSYTNIEKNEINKLARISLKNAGILQDKGREFASGYIGFNKTAARCHEKVEIEVGERIVFKNNMTQDHEGFNGFANNELGVVTKILNYNEHDRSGQFIVNKDNGKQIIVNIDPRKKRNPEFKHAYALTNYALQGTSIKELVLSINKYMGSEEFLVGISRHIETLEIIGNKKELEDAVYKNKDLDIELAKRNYEAAAYNNKADTRNIAPDARSNIDIWKIGLNQLTSRVSNLSLVDDYRYNIIDQQQLQELQLKQDAIKIDREKLQSHHNNIDQIDYQFNQRQEVTKTAEELANSSIIDIIKDKIKPPKVEYEKHNQLEKELDKYFILSDHEPVCLDSIGCFASATYIKEQKTEEEQVNHIRALKAGVIENEKHSKLVWHELPKLDQNLIIWDIIGQDNQDQIKEELAHIKSLNKEISKSSISLDKYRENIKIKSASLTQESDIPENIKIIDKYLTSGIKMREHYQKLSILDNKLHSSRVTGYLAKNIINRFELNKAEEQEVIKALEKISARNIGHIALYINNASDEYNRSEEEILARMTSNVKHDIRVSKGVLTSVITKKMNLLAYNILSSSKYENIRDLNTDIVDVCKALKDEREIRQEHATSIVDNVKQDKLTNQGGKEQKESNNYISMKNALAQLNVNIENVKQHSIYSEYKTYFEDKYKGATICDYSFAKSAYGAIMEITELSLNSDLNKDELQLLHEYHSDLRFEIGELKEYIDYLYKDIEKLESDKSDHEIKINLAKSYCTKEFGQYLTSIYEETANTLIKSLDDMLEKSQDKEQLIMSLQGNPEMLGTLKGPNLLSKFFNTSSNQEFNHLISQLRKRCGEYMMFKGEINQDKQINRQDIYSYKINAINAEIKELSLLLPNNQEAAFIDEIGQKTKNINFKKDADYIKHSQEITDYLKSKEIQDLLLNYQNKISREQVNEKTITSTDHIVEAAAYNKDAESTINNPNILQEHDEIHAVNHVENLENIEHIYADNLRYEPLHNYLNYDDYEPIYDIDHDNIDNKTQVKAEQGYKQEQQVNKPANIFKKQPIALFWPANKEQLEEINKKAGTNIDLVEFNNKFKDLLDKQGSASKTEFSGEGHFINYMSKVAQGIENQKYQTNIKPEGFKYDVNEIEKMVSSSAIEELFHRYAPNITGEKIKKSGGQLISGSLNIDINTGKWNRFSSGDRGNQLTGFVAYALGGGQHSYKEALEIVADKVGYIAENIEHSNKDKASINITNHNKQQDDMQQLKLEQEANIWQKTAITKPLKESELSWIKDKNIDAIYPFIEKTAEGEKILGYTLRVVDKNPDITGEYKKQVLPLIKVKHKDTQQEQWKFKGFTASDSSKPIYRQEHIDYDKPILIVEGEKAADAAAKRLPEMTVISWLGGSSAVDKVNWSLLKGREVVIWPDNDAAGYKAANNIKEHIDAINSYNGLCSIVNIKKLSDDITNPDHEVNQYVNDHIHNNTANSNIDNWDWSSEEVKNAAIHSQKRFNFPQKWDLADELPKHVEMQDIRDLIADAKTDKIDLVNTQDVTLYNNTEHAISQLTTRRLRQDIVSKEIYKLTLTELAKQHQAVSWQDDANDAINSLSYRYNDLASSFDGHVENNRIKTIGNNILEQEQLNKELHIYIAAKDKYNKIDLVPDITVDHVINSVREVSKEVESERIGEQYPLASKLLFEKILNPNWRDELQQEHVQLANSELAKVKANNIEELIKITAKNDNEHELYKTYLKSIQTLGLEEKQQEIIKEFKTNTSEGKELLTTIGQKSKEVLSDFHQNKDSFKEMVALGANRDDVKDQYTSYIIDTDKELSQREKDSKIKEMRVNVLDSALHSKLSTIQAEKQKVDHALDALPLFKQEHQVLNQAYNKITDKAILEDSKYGELLNIAKDDKAINNIEQVITQHHDTMEHKGALIGINYNNLQHAFSTTEEIDFFYKTNNIVKSHKEQKGNAIDVDHLFKIVKQEAASITEHFKHPNIEKYSSINLPVEYFHKQCTDEVINKLHNYFKTEVESNNIEFDKLALYLKVSPIWKIKEECIALVVDSCKKQQQQATSISEYIESETKKIKFLADNHGTIERNEYNSKLINELEEAHKSTEDQTIDNLHNAAKYADKNNTTNQQDLADRLQNAHTHQQRHDLAIELKHENTKHNASLIQKLHNDLKYDNHVKIGAVQIHSFQQLYHHFDHDEHKEFLPKDFDHIKEHAMEHEKQRTLNQTIKFHM